MFTVVLSKPVFRPLQLMFASAAFITIPASALASDEDHLCYVTQAQVDEDGAFIDFESGTNLKVNRAGDPLADYYYIAAADWEGEPGDASAQRETQIFLGNGDDFAVTHYMMTQCTGKLERDADGIPVLKLEESSGSLLIERSEAMALSTAPSGSDLLDLTIEWSSAIRAQPALYAELRNEIETFRREVSALAATLRAEDPKVDLPPLGGAGQGDMAGMTQQLISISFAYDENSGVSGTAGWLWDKKTHENMLTPQKIFTDRLTSLQPQYCDALAQEWSKRGDGDAQYNPDQSSALYQESWGCPAMDDLQIVLIGDGAFTHARLIANPGIAGPTTEDPFTITLPLGPDQISRVMPEYRASFTAIEDDGYPAGHVGMVMRTIDAYMAAFPSMNDEPTMIGGIAYNSEPESLLPISDGYILLTSSRPELIEPEIPGYLGAYLMQLGDDGFIVAQRWPDAILGNGNGDQPDWEARMDFGPDLVIVSTTINGAQGYRCSYTSVTSLTSAGPRELARFQSNYTSADGETHSAQISAIKPGESFTVRHTSADGQNFDDQYVRRGDAYILTQSGGTMPYC